MPALTPADVRTLANLAYSRDLVMTVKTGSREIRGIVVSFGPGGEFSLSQGNGSRAVVYPSQVVGIEF